MPELTPAQIAALPEEWQKMAHDTTRIRQAVGLVYDPFHEIRLCDHEDLLAALADATLRAEQTALQPGQVAVDEADLRALVDKYESSCDVCDGCMLAKAYSCPVWSRVMPEDISWGDCRAALLAHFGLAPAPEATDA